MVDHGGSPHPLSSPHLLSSHHPLSSSHLLSCPHPLSDIIHVRPLPGSTRKLQGFCWQTMKGGLAKGKCWHVVPDMQHWFKFDFFPLHVKCCLNILTSLTSVFHEREGKRALLFMVVFPSVMICFSQNVPTLQKRNKCTNAPPTEKKKRIN